MKEAEGYLLGKEVNEKNAEAAAELALKNANPMNMNEYKLVELKAHLKQAILRMS
jgi:CO/xanthine dehydrogenase FAD-binding subunit